MNNGVSKVLTSSGSSYTGSRDFENEVLKYLILFLKKKESYDIMNDKINLLIY